MLPDIQPGNTKILYFFNCLLDGMHTKHADEALYTTKRSGRDGFRIYHEVEEKKV